MHNGRTTLNKFIIEEQRRTPGATGEFSALLNDLVTACTVIALSVAKGGLAGVLATRGPRTSRGSGSKSSTCWRTTC